MHTHNQTNLQAAPLMLDVAGFALTSKERERLAHPLVGGVILFARNWQNREQLTQLCAAIKRIRKDLLIAVDHEGGRVQRFQGDGFTHLPPMAALGQLWQRNPAAGSQAATACGYVLAAELRACGVDFSFTPVLDLDYTHSTVIGDRAFARKPEVASQLAQALAHGLLQAGMRNCGKHFPGHGFVAADSHTSIPIDERPLDAILHNDAKPYAWLHNVLDSIMPAHVLYPAVDSKPAGFSRIWLQDILRQRLGFAGAIFSDDLNMQGARQLGAQPLSYAQAASLALNAGCDMVLLCNQSIVEEGKAIDALINTLNHTLGHDLHHLDPASAQRRLALLPDSPHIRWEQLVQQPRYHAALRIVQKIMH